MGDAQHVTLIQHSARIAAAKLWYDQPANSSSQGMNGLPH
jgi:hypothetical protein